MKEIGENNTIEGHLYQGRLHSVKGEYEKALEEYRRALEIDPNCKPAKVNLGFISYMKGPWNKDKIASNKYARLPKRNRKKQ